jgi:hypothetical protein
MVAHVGVEPVGNYVGSDLQGLSTCRVLDRLEIGQTFVGLSDKSLDVIYDRFREGR